MEAQIKNTITLCFKTETAQNIKAPEYLTKSQNGTWPIRMKSKIIPCQFKQQGGNHIIVHNAPLAQEVGIQH
jgi:hypothetical protein